MTAVDGDLAPALSSGLVELGLSLDSEQQLKLLRYLALIRQWNRVYNLTALREPGQMLTQHLLDSLAVVGPLRRQIERRGWCPAALRLLDVGSGAGLPGIAIAIACPELSITSVDTVGKKAGFMRQAGGELELPNFTSVHARVESMSGGPWHVIACRAFASLNSFTRLTARLLVDDGLWLAMKGKPPDEEIAHLPGSVGVFHVEPLHVPALAAERCIVWMHARNLGQ